MGFSSLFINILKKKLEKENIAELFNGLLLEEIKT
jgi:hypothetical protein